MAHATTPGPVETWSETGKIALAAKILVSAGLVALAVGFVLKYVFHYYLNYNQAAFDPYWSRRGWLMLHMSGGTLALLSGPWQFWSGLRQKHLHVHRWTGRLFLLGVAMSVTGATYLAITTTYGWAFGTGLVVMAWAQATAAAMALYFILRGQIQIHKEWMIRAYIITFGFVTFRVLNDYGPTSRLQPDNDRGIIVTWTCWVVPLFIAEIILQFRRLRRA